MGRATFVPVTPEVLDWAMKEAGRSVTDVADQLDVSSSVVRAWLQGEAHPTLTQFRKLAAFLGRTPSTLLLPAAPPLMTGTPKFRRPMNADRTDLSPTERRVIREAKRAQETLAWILKELGEPGAALEQIDLSANVEQTAARTRKRLTGSENGNFASRWKSPSEAVQGWRSILEESRVFVFVLSMGKESCSGFSLSDDRAPLIAVNTARNPSARIFTTFHEYGHLLTRTDSACLDTSKAKLARSNDPAERWCERFAAAFLMPRTEVDEQLRRQLGTARTKVHDLSVPARLALHFKVSLRAATLRLIELGTAEWSLYASIPAYSDLKTAGGGGGGRDRGQIRRDEYGNRAVNFFVRALDSNVLGRAEVLDYLDVADTHLEQMQRRRAAG